MAVPNTTTFSLQDVVNEINPITDDLVACFAAANPDYFNPLYEGNKDNLLNFRDYGSHNAASDYSISASPNSFSVTYRKTTKSSTVTTLPTAGKWSVQSSPSWINAYKSNYNTVVMQIQENTGEFGRIGSVILVHDDDSNVTESINIGQDSEISQ